MKLLFITQNYYPSKGGMAESCTRIVRNLRKSGVEVNVLHFTNRGKPYTIKKENNGCYTALAIHESEEYSLNLANLFLEQNIISLEFDAIIAFGGYLPMMWTPIISKFFNRPLYTCIRGNDFDEGIFSKKREILFFALQNSEIILSVTQEKQTKISRLFPNNASFYTPNGIDTHFWLSNPKEIESALEHKNNLTDKKVVLIAGQLKFKKGISFFIESFAQFPFKNGYELWLVGDISENVKEFINQFELNVRYFPFALKNDMKLYYQAADVVCIPSLYDGMPNVLLEAAAAKNLIIGASVGGIPDVITHLENGLLYNPLQPNALLDVLIQYHYLSESDKNQMSENLLETVKNNFTEQQEIQNYLNILLN